MSTLSEAVRELSREVGQLGERVDGVREDVRETRVETKAEITALRHDVQELKSSRTQGKAWLSGVLATVSLVFTALTWILRVAPLVLLFSCAESSAAHWKTLRPTLLVDTSMPEACVRNADRAWAFWRGARPDLGVIEMPYPSSPYLGEIRVRSRQLGDPEVMGYTQWQQSGDQLLRVEVWIAPVACSSVLVMLHEVGHALGLEHNLTKGSIMYPDLSGAGWGVTDSEVDWIDEKSTGR